MYNACILNNCSYVSLVPCSEYNLMSPVCNTAHTMLYKDIFSGVDMHYTSLTNFVSQEIS